MAQQLRSTISQVQKVKTVHLLLAAYFSTLVVMVVFTAFFVYTNFRSTDTVAAVSLKEKNEIKNVSKPGNTTDQSGSMELKSLSKHTPEQ